MSQSDKYNKNDAFTLVKIMNSYVRVKMVLPHFPSTVIRRQKLAGFVATPSPRRRQLAHAATSVTESVP